MAAKAKNTQKDKKVVGLQSLVQFPLMPDEVNEVHTWKLSAEEMMTMIADYVSEGIRFEISANTKKKGFSILTKFAIEGMRNEGIGFYSNGDSLNVTLAVVLVKLGLLGNRNINDFLSERTTEETFS